MFERIVVPTPFQVGPVNTYLAGRTLVDPGPDSEEAWSTLLDALDARGLSPEDIEQVLVTHAHPDHFGVAHRFADRGARVLGSEATASSISDFPAQLRTEQSYFRSFFEQCGMASTTARTVTNLPEAFLEYAPSVAVDEVVATGDTVLVGDTPLDVLEVEGHAAGELLFVYDHEGQRRAIVGDHVLPEITPNPFLRPPAAADGHRPRVLPAYNDSLERLRERPIDRMLPGHREEIPDPSARIDAIRESHERRTAEVADIVSGPVTPVEVSEQLFGDLPATEMFSGMGEAVGHLDVLEARGEVEPTERGGLLVYEPR
jgi:glyoxylase-like metal-dependent hydrolase (beta-lactamase superfamily II)